MPIDVNDIPQAIIDGVFKVIRQSQKPTWPELKDKRVSDLFAGVADPTSWPNFFLEAAAWAVQMELMEEGSYCRGLDAKMKELEGGTGTWMKLFLWIDENVESIS